MLHHFKRAVVIAMLCTTMSSSLQAHEMIKKDWATLSTESKNAVVLVRSYNVIDNIFEPYQTPRQGANGGSAFFVKEQNEYYLLTNFHVVENAFALYVEVPSCGKEQFEAELVCARPYVDLALLKLKPGEQYRLEQELKSPIPFLTLGDSDAIEKTEQVMALGFPLTDEGLKTTTGIISGKERFSYEYLLQITAPINFGNSGGPTLNAYGEVIGMNTSTHVMGQNTSYMVASNTMKRFVKSALQKDTAIIQRRPTLGIVYSIANPALYRYLGCSVDKGVYLQDTIPGSLFDVHGVKKGDVLHTIDGFEIDRHGYVCAPWSQDRVHFYDVVSRHEQGDELKLGLDRKGEDIQIVIPYAYKDVLAIDDVYPRYQEIEYEMLGGFVVVQLTASHVEASFAHYVSMIRSGHGGAPNLNLAKYLQGKNCLEPRVMVSKVIPDSPADKANIGAGMILDKVNGVSVRTLQDFRDAVIESKQTGLLVIQSETEALTVVDVDKIIEQEDTISRLYFNGLRSQLVDKLK